MGKINPVCIYRPFKGNLALFESGLVLDLSVSDVSNQKNGRRESRDLEVHGTIQIPDPEKIFKTSCTVFLGLLIN